MKHYGVILNAYEVMLIARSVTFQYDVITIPDIYNGEIPFASVSTHAIEEIFFHSLGISYVKERIGSSEDEWEYMKGLIDQDRPVLFRIDSRFLQGQHESFGKLNLYYVSTLLLVGYDDVNENVLVVLTNTDEKQTVTELSYTEFQKYRYTNCIPYNPDYVCYYLADDSGISRLTDEKIREAVMNGLKDIVDTMFYKGSLNNTSYGAFSGSLQFRGLNGMHELVNDLRQLKSDYKDGGDITRKIIKFNMVFLRNNLLFGSHTAFRHEFAGCLHMCKEKYGFLSFSQYAEEMERTGENWMRFFNILSGAAHSNDDITCKLEEAIVLFDSIALEEEKIFTRIRDDLEQELVN